MTMHARSAGAVKIMTAMLLAGVLFLGAACMACAAPAPAATDSTLLAEPHAPSASVPAPANGSAFAYATQPDMEFGWGGYFQAIGAVFLILAALVCGFWLLRKFGPNRLGGLGRGDMVLEGQLSLGPKKNVVVVRFLNKRLVLGVTDSNINLLTEAVIGNDDEDRTFSETLDKACGKDSR